jgi:hypothetical protein
VIGYEQDELDLIPGGDILFSPQRSYELWSEMGTGGSFPGDKAAGA